MAASNRERGRHLKIDRAERPKGKPDIEKEIRALAKAYADDLKSQIDDRTLAMEEDDTSHRLIYRVLGVTDEEGKLIDIYQNKGRFLYKYAGAFLEEAAIFCFKSKFHKAQPKVKLPNPLGTRPKTFEIDCLIGKEAFEIKWRDATTDGDHITKEHARIKAISSGGLKPIRVMFYYPNRDQAIRIQDAIRTLYLGLNGEYYSGEAAWEYIKQRTDIDLLSILTKIATENVSKKMIILGDCLTVMRTFDAESIDMVYLDPPFFTQKVHRLTPRNSNREYLFEDVWESLDEYKAFISDRVRECHRLLRRTGSLFLHCHRAASHHLRLILDDVFGPDNFESEIIWRYRRWSNAKKGLLSAHQTIYFYSKTSEFKFNFEYTDYSPTTNIDQILQRRERGSNGKAVYKRLENGEIDVGGVKKGVPLTDVWELPYLNPKAAERTGYPTQKPLHLMERIIELVTDEGDVVLDPFCGSGTTLIAAKMLNRRFRGIDRSAEAINLTETRLAAPVRSDSGLLENGITSYVNQTPEIATLLTSINAVVVQRNNGIDGFLCHDFEGKPVPVRIQRAWESLEQARSKFREACKNKGCLRRVLIVTKPYESDSLFEKQEIDDPDLIIVNSLNITLENALNEAKQPNERPRTASA
jgi:site-specific DNA-methyltransferase (adenine-specific)